MSTAAPPAAGSPAAPVAAPTEVSGQPTAGSPAGEPKAARTIKPIPPPPRLPGVLEDGPQDATAPESVAERARDAAGRFAKTAEGEPIVGKPGPKAVDAPEFVPDAPDAVEPFKFADRSFKSQAEAEHYFKSLEGRHKPIQQKATETHGQLVKAAESARGWHGEAQRLAARVAELEAGAAPVPESGTTVPNAGIDWALYADIAKVANEAGEPWKAQQWLQEQTDALRKSDAEALRQEIARLRDEAIENPRREAEEQAQIAQTADALVASMAAHQNPDGTPAFPEFRDGETARAVGELWQSMGNDPREALTPQGAVNAIALYRLAQSMGVAPVPPSPLPPNHAADAAAGLEGGRPLMPAATNRRELDPSVARLVAGLKNRELIRPGLGFEA